MKLFKFPKPEVLDMGYHGKTYRWWNNGYATTLNAHSFFRSYAWGYFGVRFTKKEFLIGVQVWKDTGLTVNIYPLPMVNIVIHFRGKEKTKCETRKTSTLSTLRLCAA